MSTLKRANFLTVLFPCVLLAALGAATQAPRAEEPSANDAALKLELRSRLETSPGSGRFHVATRVEQWKPEQTAIIVCDMWDLHHCLNAVRRGEELIPRMSALLKFARERGVTIIHAPSHCMKSYENHAARKRAQQVPLSKELPVDIVKWCYRIPAEERGDYPIDQTDGGEDDDPEEHAAWAKKLASMGLNPRAPWTRQAAALEILDQDYISDQGDEIWSILEQNNLQNVMLVGVHTNMCVLGRPFGLRQLAKNGKNVVLVRDLTDTMYNPAKAPFVSHFTGTDLIVEHIEKFVCPTITSDQLLGGKPFRFKNDRRPRLLVVIGEDEYQTERTLPTFAREQLGRHFSVEFVFASDQDRHQLPGLERLDDFDLALCSVRRRALPPEQMDAVRRFVAAGKPVLGIRTANHAFSLKGQTPPKGRQTWEDFDATVIGGHYTGHSSGNARVSITRALKEHPVLDGLSTENWTSAGTLYLVSPLAESATPLLTGTLAGHALQPVAWVHQRADGGRTFYTSLGHPNDFNSPEYNRLLRQAVYWMADVKLTDRVAYGE